MADARTGKAALPASRPILFSGPMVQALLREIEQPGTGKTMTRRLATSPLSKREPGEELWVRERTLCIAARDGEIKVRYEADWHEPDVWLPLPDRLKQRPVPGKRLSMGCYREAARLKATVTGKRFEPLQDITPLDAIREGAVVLPVLLPGSTISDFAKALDEGRLATGIVPGIIDAWIALWNGLHNRPGERWADNPLVVALSFQPARLTPAGTGRVS